MRKLGRAMLALFPCACAVAHPDDPKVRDRQPPFRGPGWRASRPDEGTRSNFPAYGVELLSWLSLPELNPAATSGSDCWGYTSPSGREYALIGISTGIAIVEVTNPADARLVAHIGGPTSLWRDVQVYGTYAYGVSEGGHGIQVVDLSGIDEGRATLVREVTGDTPTSTHTVLINPDSGFLYRCGGSGNGLRIYDLKPDPSNPQYVTAWSDKYVHECLPLNYQSGPYAGKEIVLACDGFNGGGTDTGLEILDVTNKANIVSMSRVRWENPGYSHQVWVSDDRHYAFLNDEFDESNYGNGTRIIVIDIANLNAPFVAAYYTSSNPSIGHNFYVKDGLLYAANYRSGLRIYDISNPLDMQEKYSFDTYIQSDAPVFNGLWGNFPYFASGTIIGSDLEKGLFVWRLMPLEITLPDGTPQIVNPRGSSFPVHIAPVGTNQLDPASPKLSYVVDGIAGSTPLTPLEDGDWLAILPPSTCGGIVNFSISAASSTGAVVTNPPAGGNDALAAFGQSVAVSDDMEADDGWTVGNPNDDASSGIWLRAAPVKTGAQPGEDHSPVGTVCWVTGNGDPDSGIMTEDVDGGATTLTTTTYNLAALEDPRIGYWRWYSNSSRDVANTEIFEIEISNDGGANWTGVEIVGPGGIETAGGWYYQEFRVADIIAPTANVKMRFRASDYGADSIVEAALDDFQVFSLICETCQSDINGDLVVDLSDLGVVLSDYGLCAGSACQGDLNGDGSVNLSDLGIVLTDYGAHCP